MSALAPRRGVVFRRAGVAALPVVALRLPAFLPTDFFFEDVLPGRAARLAVAFFFELRDRVVAVFFLDFFDEALAADFFRVTFFPEPLRFAVDLPAFFVVFLPDDFFFVTVFLLVFFLLVFFLPVFFLLDAVFLVEPLAAGFAFLRDVAFFLLTFFARAAAARVPLRPDAVFFELFFLVAAFFFGIRRILRWPQNQAGDYT